MSKFSFIKNDDSLTVFIEGGMYTVPADSIKYRACLNAIKADDGDALKTAVLKAETVATIRVPDANNQVSEVVVRVTPDGVFVNDKPVHNEVGNRILRYNSEGLPYDSMVKFLENLYQNPVFELMRNPETRNAFNLSDVQAESYVEELINDMWQFLSAHGHPITEDGCFLAYKAVRSDLMDKHTGTVKNDIGAVIEMNRNGVDPNRDNECSNGYHVGNIGYVDSFGSGDDVKLVVKVNPRDVVRVPKKDSTKMRVCRYEVLSIYKETLQKSVYKAQVNEVEEVTGNASPNIWSKKDDFLRPEQVRAGDNIKFVYNSGEGNQTRYLSVEDSSNGYVKGTLIEPEGSAGSFRQFLAGPMLNISLYRSVESTVDYNYSSVLDEDDEDEEEEDDYFDDEDEDDFYDDDDDDF